MEEVPNIIISDLYIPNTNAVNIPPWVGKPAWSFGPSVPVTVDIGTPVVNIPGCVKAHELNNQKNKNLTEDDPDKTLTYCDAGVPAFETIDYREDELIFEQETVVPDIAPPPEIDTPEVTPPNIPPTEKEVRRSAIYSTLKVRFNKQPNKSRYHRSKKDQRDCDHKFHLEAI